MFRVSSIFAHTSSGDCFCVAIKRLPGTRTIFPLVTIFTAISPNSFLGSFTTFPTISSPNNALKTIRSSSPSKIWVVADSFSRSIEFTRTIAFGRYRFYPTADGSVNIGIRGEFEEFIGFLREVLNICNVLPDFCFRLFLFGNIPAHSLVFDNRPVIVKKSPVCPLCPADTA